MTRAKFYVAKIENQIQALGSSPITMISLQAVSTGSDENKEFFKWTPSGTLSLGVVSEDTAAKFELGKEYYIDFSAVEPT